MLSRLQVYQSLWAYLYNYSEKLNSVDIEIFAIEMEFIPGHMVSSDPALFSEFTKLLPEKVTLSDAYRLSADFVEAEIVQLRQREVAKQVVADLRAASADPSSATEELGAWAAECT